MSQVHALIGNGGAKAFAYIHAEYPEGSTCTCSKGSKTLTAKDASGVYNFSVPEDGTWTVRCTDGTDSAEQQVVIDPDIEYQVKNVSLSYVVDLYKNGVELKTWGLQDSKATKAAEYIQMIVSSSNTMAWFSDSGKYSFSSSHTTLHATFHVVSGTGTSTFAALFVRDSLPSSMASINSGAADLVSSMATTWTAGNDYTVDLDISSFAGTEKYVIFGVRYGCNIQLKHVWID